MNFPRSCGILLHPTSLPGPFGIGDLGPEAFAFVDFLVSAEQSLWQILPVGPTGYGNSPYSSYSAFAGNTLLINPEKLVEEGLVTGEDLTSVVQSPEKVNYEAAISFKDELVRSAHEAFHSVGDSALRGSFEIFCQENSWWLDDYALFRAIKTENGRLPWYEWETRLRMREPLALARKIEELRAEIDLHKFSQFIFFRQWQTLKSYANEQGVRIIGDIAIFVAHDSADVWAKPELFKLDEAGMPTVVAGVPPDYFSPTGQLWGNPIYDWDELKREGFRWWIDRVRWTLEIVDIARVDHFRGFVACWEIPAGDKTAENGVWVKAPGEELFAAIQGELGELRIIAEDLGVITADVKDLRAGFGFPGMHVLQFAFGGDAANGDLPHNHAKNSVVYTGTHDNDTTRGWFGDLTRDGSKESQTAREFCLKYLDTTGEDINWNFIRAAFASVANTAIVPLQDVLGLGSEARMNTPSSNEGNWEWRLQKESLRSEHADRLRELTEIYGRLGVRRQAKRDAALDDAE